MVVRTFNLDMNQYATIDRILWTVTTFRRFVSIFYNHTARVRQQMTH